MVPDAHLSPALWAVSAEGINAKSKKDGGSVTSDFWCQIGIGFLKPSFPGWSAAFQRTQVQSPYPQTPPPSLFLLHKICCPLLASLGTSMQTVRSRTYRQSIHTEKLEKRKDKHSVYHWSVECFESRIYFLFPVGKKWHFLLSVNVSCWMLGLSMPNKIGT